jgi:hypothetical protein
MRSEATELTKHDLHRGCPYHDCLPPGMLKELQD